MVERYHMGTSFWGGRFPLAKRFPDGQWVRYSAYEQVAGWNRENKAEAQKAWERVHALEAGLEREIERLRKSKLVSDRQLADRLDNLITEHGGGGSGSEQHGAAPETSIRPTHNPQIERLDNGCYRPGCLCGWRGVARRGRHEAERDFFAHGSGTRAEGS